MSCGAPFASSNTCFQVVHATWITNTISSTSYNNENSTTAGYKPLANPQKQTLTKLYHYPNANPKPNYKRITIRPNPNHFSGVSLRGSLFAVSCRGGFIRVSSTTINSIVAIVIVRFDLYCSDYTHMKVAGVCYKIQTPLSDLG